MNEPGDRDEGTRGYRFALPDDPRHRDRLAEIGQLAGGLVHELKNPLGAIKLNVDMLLQQCDEEDLDRAKLRRRLGRIAEGTRNLQTIIQSFLGFARPGRPDRDRVDVNALIEEILAEQRPCLDEAGIGVTFLPTADLHAVPADRSQLRSVFLNIILNARDALLLREEQRKLIIATRNRQGGIRVVLANNGPPLGEQAAAHLFDPFYSSKENGTGLGLAIVRRLLELHNGQVTAISDPAQGVSFTVELPTTLGPARARAELPLPEAVGVESPDTT